MNNVIITRTFYVATCCQYTRLQFSVFHSYHTCLFFSFSFVNYLFLVFLHCIAFDSKEKKFKRLSIEKPHPGHLYPRKIWQSWRCELHADDLDILNGSPENQLKHVGNPTLNTRKFPCINNKN